MLPRQALGHLELREVGQGPPEQLGVRRCLEIRGFVERLQRTTSPIGKSTKRNKRKPLTSTKKRWYKSCNSWKAFSRIATRGKAVYSIATFSIAT